jgi:hypothetical protein
LARSNGDQTAASSGCFFMPEFLTVGPQSESLTRKSAVIACEQAEDGRTKGNAKERRVSGLSKKPPAEQERGQRPLWIAIGGLLVSVISYTMRDLMLGDVVFWFGVVLAFIGVLYWFIRPKHGL